MAINLEPGKPSGFWTAERKQPHAIENLWDFAYRMSLSQFGNFQDAQDNAQDTIYQSLKGGDSYHEGNPNAWFSRVCANQGYDTLRRRQRRPQDSLEVEMESGNEPVSPAFQQNPELEAERSELKQILTQELQKLPVGQRLAIELCDLQGLSYEEAAARTNEAKGTLKSRISRGRSALKQGLISQGYKP